MIRPWLLGGMILMYLNHPVPLVLVRPLPGIRTPGEREGRLGRILGIITHPPPRTDAVVAVLPEKGSLVQASAVVIDNCVFLPEYRGLQYNLAVHGYLQEATAVTNSNGTESREVGPMAKSGSVRR